MTSSAEISSVEKKHRSNQFVLCALGLSALPAAVWCWSAVTATATTTSKCPFTYALQFATTSAVVAGIYFLWKRNCCRAKCDDCKYKVNPGIDKSNPKVVNTVDIEDIGDKAVFCRCWRSAKFPFCDGAHTKFNQESGENVGPLIVQKKK